MTATMAPTTTTRCVLESEFGIVAVEFSDTAVTRIQFDTFSPGTFSPETPARAKLLKWQQEALEALEAYLAGKDIDLSSIPVDLSTQTPFRQRVQAECRKIGYGATATYAELAKRAGQPAAVRAVGSAMSHNPIPILIPCHRVVRSDGSVGGFSAPQGVSLKEQLLAMERR